MAYAGKVEDMPPEDRYSSSRLWALINQAVRKPWLREIFGGFLYKIEDLQDRVSDGTVQVVLFVDGEHKDTMSRYVVPSVEDTIVIDCGEMVRVTEVSHQWDDPTFVQVNSVTVPQEEMQG